MKKLATLTAAAALASIGFAGPALAGDILLDLGGSRVNLTMTCEPNTFVETTLSAETQGRGPKTDVPDFDTVLYEYFDHVPGNVAGGGMAPVATGASLALGSAGGDSNDESFDPDEQPREHPAACTGVRTGANQLLVNATVVFLLDPSGTLTLTARCGIPNPC